MELACNTVPPRKVDSMSQVENLWKKADWKSNKIFLKVSTQREVVREKKKIVKKSLNNYIQQSDSGKICK